MALAGRAGNHSSSHAHIATIGHIEISMVPKVHALSCLFGLFAVIQLRSIEKIEDCFQRQQQSSEFNSYQIH